MALTKNRPETVADPEGDLAFLEQAIEQKQKANPVSKKLSEHIHGVWVRNQNDFKKVRKDMVHMLRRVKGEYDPKKLTAIKAFRGSETYLRNVETKARAACSWIEDIYRGDTDLPWSLDPTEIPNLPDETIQQITFKTQQQAAALLQRLKDANLQIPPDEISKLINDYHDEQLDKAKADLKKEAKERCDRAAQLIRDQNQEGGWDAAFKDFLYYFVRLPFGIIKGPVLTKKPKQSWQYTPETGPQLIVTEELVNDVYAVSPFNFFPSRGMTNINDGDTIEIHELTLSSLHDMIGVPGYSEVELRAVISKFEKGKIKSRWFVIDDETEVRHVTKETKNDNNTVGFGNSTPGEGANISPSSKPTTVLAQEFYGTISGELLLEWGSQEPGLDKQKQYQCNCWKIDQHVIKAVVSPDPLGRKPYHLTSWAKNPEWIIGEGLIQYGGPIEDAMNAIVRASVNNVAIASGPMAEIDRDRVDMRTPIYPWRQIESTSDQMNSKGPAVNYYQPQMHIGELTQAYAFFGKLLDEMTVPAYAQGASQSGVTAGTATVFTQLLAAASRSIKAVVANIDDDIIKPYIEMCYDHNMKFSKDPDIKGDANVVAKGVSGLQAKEQAAQRKVEFLQVMANPSFQQILGARNTGAVIAQIAKSQDIKLPDMARLDGEEDLSQSVEKMLMSQAGVDPMQANGQMAQGGGAPTSPQGMLPDGSKAGVVNA